MIITNKKKSKKAVSVIIGYILLISLAVILGAIIYKWMKSYAPQEEINCQDKVSLYIQSYELKDGLLTVHIKNNGNFDLGGYYIYGTNTSEDQIATIDLSPYNINNDSRLNPSGIKFGIPETKNSLVPGQIETDVYNLTLIGGKIYSLEIVPIAWLTENRKTSLVRCKDFKIQEEVFEYAPCVPESAQQTCDRAGVDCGTELNNCDLEVDCGSCSGGNVCNPNGLCVSVEECTDTCTSLGWACGGPICGQDCGSCSLNHASTSSCDGGNCIVVECAAGWYDCDLSAFNGCEALLGTNTNCGFCGDICADGFSCDGQNCVSVCIPETNAEFCDRLGKNCGSLTAEDNCGDPRTVTNCGICSLPQTCGGGGVSNVCGCTANCTGKQCGGDGCSGTCGNYGGGCQTGFACSLDQQCVSTGGGGITCIDYCGTLGLGYTTSACLANSGQCGSQGGDYYSAGNGECTGASGGTRCCCFPAI